MTTVVVTGGAHGMGAATVTRLLARGCEVHVLDVETAAPAGARVHRCDLADPAAIDAAVDALPARIDALANVAGVPGPEPATTVVAVNFLGLRHLTESLLPRMPQGSGVVNVASMAGQGWQRRRDVVEAVLATPDFDAGLGWLEDNRERWARDPYTFSKQCAVAYTFRAAGLARDQGVRVNCVSPGAIATRITPEFRAQMGEAQYAWNVEQVGEGVPDDVAAVVEWLAVGDCRWVNGVDLPVDGGFTAGTLAGWIDVGDSPAVQARRRKD